MTEPSLSPDRKEIAFVSGGDIWSVPADGGAARLLVSYAANESWPLFSPDGRFLAFGSNRTGDGDIYSLELDSGSLRRLTFDDANDQLDAWSRDGKWIYFTSSSRDISGMNDIYRVAASGGTPMQVSSDRYTSEFQASPLADGSIVFERNFRIWKMKTDGGKAAEVPITLRRSAGSWKLRVSHPRTQRLLKFSFSVFSVYSVAKQFELFVAAVDQSLKFESELFEQAAGNIIM